MDTHYTATTTLPEEKEKPKKKFNVIGCNCCHATNLPLIKATDSYYCKFCFNKLKKKKFEKRKGG